MSRLRPVAALLAACLMLAGCGAVPGLGEADPGGERGIGTGFGEPEVVAGGLEAPWGLAFLPDGERAGRRARHRPDPAGPARAAGRARSATVPGVVAGGEGGLLGLAVSPDLRARPAGLRLLHRRDRQPDRPVPARRRPQPEVARPGIPKAGIHNGGRIAFGPDGMLYAGTGDAGRAAAAQDRASLDGKILRMTPDGQRPAGQPVPGLAGVQHRPPQRAGPGLGRAAAGCSPPSSGRTRCDELNLIEPGGNYGWPEVEGTGGGERFSDPLVTWTTDEASPSGAAIAGDTLYRGGAPGRAAVDGPAGRPGGTGEPAAVSPGTTAGCAVAVAPDGSLWVPTSNRDGRGDPASADDRILRFPALTGGRTSWEVWRGLPVATLGESGTTEFAGSV